MFTDEQEKALCYKITELEEEFSGLTSTEVRRLAYDFAEYENIKHCFNKNTGLAGRDWFSSFMRRNEFSLRTAEFTSIARINGFNEIEVKKFFALLKKKMDEKNFNPANIYNCDETGITVNPKCQSKIVAKKGRRRVGGKTTAERGETVTAELCMSATGNFLPPVLIFPRVKVNNDFLVGKPANSWAVFHKSGWMDAEIFSQWFEWFIKQVHASHENPVLLLFDGYNSHVKNLKVSLLAKQHNVTLICFPPHCSHMMQVLDVVLMKPVSNEYSAEVVAFQRQGRKVQMKDIFALFGRALQRACKVSTAVKGFEITGIYPFNENIFDGKYTKKTTEKAAEVASEPANPELARYSSVLDNILQLPQASTSPVPTPSLTPPLQTSNQTSLNVPVSYLLSAKPLIECLHNFLQNNVQVSPESNLSLNFSDDSHLSSSSIKNSFTPQVASTNSQLSYHHEELQTTQCVNIAESTGKKKATKRPREKGTALEASSDEHIQKLTLAEASKKIKKEPVKRVRKEPVKRNKVSNAKENPRIKSDVILNAPIVLASSKTVPQQSFVVSQPSRMPLTDIGYQFIDGFGNSVAFQTLGFLPQVQTVKQNLDFSENSSRVEFVPQRCSFSNSEYQTIISSSRPSAQNSSYFSIIPTENNESSTMMVE